MPHIHVDGREAIVMAHAWRPDAAWYLFSRVLREAESRSTAMLYFRRGRGGKTGIWEINHIFYFI